MKRKEDNARTPIAVKLKLDVAGDVEGADGVGVSGMKEGGGRDGDGGDEEGVAC